MLVEINFWVTQNISHLDQLGLGYSDPSPNFYIASAVICQVASKIFESTCLFGCFLNVLGHFYQRWAILAPSLTKDPGHHTGGNFLS